MWDLLKENILEVGTDTQKDVHSLSIHYNEAGEGVCLTLSRLQL